MAEKSVLCDKNKFKSKIEAPEYSLDIAKKVHAFHKTIPNYVPTPFVELDNLAKNLKVSKIFVKDESKRFDLNAYKFLGVSYAVAKEILDPDDEFSWPEMVKKVSKMEQKPIFITATDGNHGYGLAYAAKLLDCEAIIFMPKVNLILSCEIIFDLARQLMIAPNQNIGVFELKAIKNLRILWMVESIERKSWARTFENCPLDMTRR